MPVTFFAIGNAQIHAFLLHLYIQLSIYTTFLYGFAVNSTHIRRK